MESLKDARGLKLHIIGSGEGVSYGYRWRWAADVGGTTYVEMGCCLCWFSVMGGTCISSGISWRSLRAVCLGVGRLTRSHYVKCSTVRAYLDLGRGCLVGFAPVWDCGKQCEMYRPSGLVYHVYHVHSWCRKRVLVQTQEVLSRDWVCHKCLPHVNRLVQLFPEFYRGRGSGTCKADNRSLVCIKLSANVDESSEGVV